jgi:Glyoxalase/Bleomycin resistance protein/Dioxygenase superfamily
MHNVASLTGMGPSKRIVPIFPVHDVTVSLEHYRRLGFSTRAYDQGGYGYAVLDGAEIHLGEIATNAATTPASAYLFVEDADQLAQTWASTGAVVGTPEDTPWGQHEGVIRDPDGNMIRFGSPMQTSSVEG